MSEANKKPMTLKGILALVGAGLVYLLSQVLGVDLSKFGGPKPGTNDKPPITAPAEPGPTKEVAKKDPKAGSGKELNGQKPQKPEAQKPESQKPGANQRDDTALIRQLFNGMRSDIQVEAEGEVVHLLPDDTDEKPHQLFLVELDNGITIKISHNTAVSPYIESLRKGDTIRFHGEYEYNDKGGVVHWTHRTQGTRNKHPHGWLLHEGVKYE